MILKRDQQMIEHLLRVAETFERDGLGRYSPNLMRRAAYRIRELSERKQLLARSILSHPDSGGI